MIDLHILTQWLTEHKEWLALTIGFIACAESLALVGLLVPGVVILTIAASLAGTGALNVWTMLFSGFIGALIGDGVSFLLGQIFRERIPRWWPFRAHPEWLTHGHAFFERHGGISIAIGRFIGPIRPIIPMVAGMLDMPARYFLIINILSSLLWAPVYLLPGYLIGASLHSSDYAPMDWLILSAILTMVSVTLMYLVAALYNKLNDTADDNGQNNVPITRLYWAGFFGCLLLTIGISATVSLFKPLDLSVFEHIQTLQTPLLTEIFTAITRIGDAPPMLCLTLLLALFIGADQLRTAKGVSLKNANGLISAGLFIGLAIALERTTAAMKMLFALPRPPLAEESSFAYPSGHTAYTTFIGLWLGWYFARFVPKRWRYWLWSLGLLLALAVAESRLYLNKHWLSDVAGGLALGSTFFMGWLLLERRFPVAVNPARGKWRAGELLVCYGGLILAFW